MSERSDWSQSLLDADRPAEVTVTFEDGTRRRLKVSLAEREHLGDAGVDVTRWHQRALAWVLKWGRKAVPWVVGVVAAALITGYATKYYADRQQELDLKTLLTTTLSTAAVRGADDALAVVNVQVESHLRGLTLVQRRNRVTAEWKAAAAVLDPLLFLHFDETAVEDHWNRYRPVMFDYLDLSYVDRGELRAASVAAIRDYLRDYPPPNNPIESHPGFSWSRLSCATLRCGEAWEWRNDYRVLGLALLRERGVLTRALLETDAERLG